MIAGLLVERAAASFVDECSREASFDLMTLLVPAHADVLEVWAWEERAYAAVEVHLGMLVFVVVIGGCGREDGGEQDKGGMEVHGVAVVVAIQMLIGVWVWIVYDGVFAARESRCFCFRDQ